MKIVTSWDDGGKSDFRIAELLEKYNLPGIFYWPCNLGKSKNMGKVKSEFLTLDDCIEISKRFEVGSHTVSHAFLTECNLQQMSNEITISKQIWESVLKKPIHSFCYPRGRHNNLVRQLVKGAGYKEARTTVVGHTQPTTDPFITNTSVHIGIDRIEYKNKCWEMYSRDILNKARNEENSIFHIFGHSWELDRENDWDALESLFKEMKQ